MTIVLPLGQAHHHEAWRVGPKASNLSLLMSAGFPVPGGFVVTTEVMDDYLMANGSAEQVASLLDQLDQASPEEAGSIAKTLRGLVLAGQPPSALRSTVQAAFHSLGGPVSVRSSSTMEDRPDVTFAGQHDTFLNVHDGEALWESLKQCWASLWSDRAVRYAQALGISPKQMKMGVLVQKMVRADVAGVAFTVNPVTGNADQASISASFGLGEATVSGQVTPDHMLFQREPLQLLEYTVGTKSAMVVADGMSGTATVELSEAQRSAACLTTEQAIRVAGLAYQVEGHVNNGPQDMEWAMEGDSLFLLQARPVVSRADPDEGVRWESPVPGGHWRRNWRLGEWISEPVTPLFGTWMLPMLVAAREEAGTGELGWEARNSFSMAKPWHCIVNGYFYTRQDRPPRPGPGPGVSAGERAATRGRTNKAYLERWRREYLPPYLERFQGHRRFEIPKASSQELLSFIDLLIDESGEFWFLMAPIGYGFEQSGFSPYYESVVPEEGRPHYVTLFVGFPSKPMEAEEALYSIAQRVKQDTVLERRFLASTPQAMVASLEELPAWFRQQLQAYQDEFGHQVFSLDVYFPTLGEAVEGLMATIQGYLRSDVPSPAAMREASAKRRDEAMSQVLASLAGTPQEQQYLREAIEGFQACAAVREDAGFYLQQPWPLVRRSVLELGLRLAEAGVLHAAEEVFFLEQDELLGVLDTLTQGESLHVLHQVAAGRRQTWERQRKLAAPDRLPVDFIVEGLDATPARIDEHGRIAAQPASPGRGRGPARLVRSPDDAMQFAKGDVLVTTAASPALTPLLLLAAGLVTEAGGGASHSSLLARELGVPAVVNAARATQVIRNGQMVEVDGTRGVVTLLGS